MKTVLTIILLALFSQTSAAQDDAIEKEFAKNRARFSVERFSMGEDATSGYDYLVYKDKSGIVKLRSIWSSSANSYPPRVEDYYFKDGKFVLYVKSALDKKLLKTTARGAQTPLKAQEKLYLKDSKLTAWLENGKTVPATDKRWQEKEKSVLESAQGELEMYKLNREEN